VRGTGPDSVKAVAAKGQPTEGRTLASRAIPRVAGWSPPPTANPQVKRMIGVSEPEQVQARRDSWRGGLSRGRLSRRPR
jgi:hypothetical protein